MQWLMRFRALWGPHKSCHGFRPAPRNLRYESLSGAGALRWSDHDRPEEFNFARDVLDHWAQMEQEGKREPTPALWWVDHQGHEVKWTFREVTDLTRRVANVFTQTCGLQQGDRLALILPRVPEWWLVSLGCMRTGIIYIPGTVQMKAKDILYRLKMSKAKAIVTTDAVVPEVDSVASECPSLKTKLLVSESGREGWLDLCSLIKSASPDQTCIQSKTMDPMTIFFTSGTTGLPKMAKHNHGLALRSCLPSWAIMELKTRDVCWCVVDPGWILATLGSLLGPWSAGSTIFIHHLPQFDPKIIIETLLKYPITQCLSSPSAFRMIIKQCITKYRFPTLEHCWTSGESLLLEEQQQWEQQLGVPFHQIYGQTETGITCAISRGMKVKLGSLGKAVLPFDVQVIDDKGNVLPPNTEGNLGIRIKPTKPIGLFMGYENDPVKTAKAEHGDFHNTGDRVTMDTEGYIWFLGRSDDIITSSGYRIGPLEIENALAEHPAVAESAAVSSPDPIRGEVVKAFVVLTPQYLSHDRDQLAKELQEHVKMVTAPYKYPRKVEFVPELPKTITGKIMRNMLRRREFGQM